MRKRIYNVGACSIIFRYKKIAHCHCDTVCTNKRCKTNIIKFYNIKNIASNISLIFIRGQMDEKNSSSN